MSDAVLIALITAVCGLLGAVLVELIRTRRRAEVAAAEVKPNGGASLRDAVNRIETQLNKVHTEVTSVRDVQIRHGERLAAVEARLDERFRHPGG